MPDPVDLGQAREQEFLEDALARHARSVPTGPSRKECVSCGDPIPAARRKAVPGCTRCIDCERDNELRARTRKGGGS
jgi:phage/conjugal plasmid C-4 type zinc finger TraR family protein